MGAYYFKPLECEGICILESTDESNCGATAPEALVYHRLPGMNVLDQILISTIEDSAQRKAFHVIGLSPSSLHLDNIVSMATEYAQIKEAISHSNHSLVIKEGLINTAWAKVDLPAIRSIIVLQNPIKYLRHWFESGLETISPTLFKSVTGLEKGNVTLDNCLQDATCRSMMGLRTACQAQTKMVCGVDCIGDLSPFDRIFRAKVALASKSSLIGFVEDLPSLIAVLRKKYPTYFEFASIEKSLEEGDKEELHFSSEATNVLNDLCKEDLAVFTEAVRMFKEVAEECGVDNVATPNLVLEQASKETLRKRWFF